MCRFPRTFFWSHQWNFDIWEFEAYRCGKVKFYVLHAETGIVENQKKKKLMYLCMFTQHSKTEYKHRGQELTTVTFIFNLIAFKTLEQSMLLVHDILRY